MTDAFRATRLKFRNVGTSRFSCRLNTNVLSEVQSSEVIILSNSNLKRSKKGLSGWNYLSKMRNSGLYHPHWMAPAWIPCTVMLIRKIRSGLWPLTWLVLLSWQPIRPRTRPKKLPAAYKAIASELFKNFAVYKAAGNLYLLVSCISYKEWKL